MNIDISNFEKYLKSEESTLWDKGNYVLYDMCNQHFNHNNIDGIMAKLWLIGRSYAAAVERRKKATDSNDSFYFIVSEKLKNSDLGRLLKEIPEGMLIGKQAIFKIYKAHKLFIDEIYPLTNLFKISLASKYLHFHRPVVPIYDSRAVKSMSLIWARDKRHLEFLSSICTDLNVERKSKYFTYLEFLVKMHFIQDYLKERTQKVYSSREIDKYFLKLQES